LFVVRYGLQCHTMMPPDAEGAQLFPLDHPPDAAKRHPPSLRQLADRKNFLVHFSSNITLPALAA